MSFPNLLSNRLSYQCREREPSCLCAAIAILPFRTSLSTIPIFGVGISCLPALMRLSLYAENNHFANGLRAIGAYISYKCLHLIVAVMPCIFNSTLVNLLPNRLSYQRREREPSRLRRRQPFRLFVIAQDYPDFGCVHWLLLVAAVVLSFGNPKVPNAFYVGSKESDYSLAIRRFAATCRQRHTLPFACVTLQSPIWYLPLHAMPDSRPRKSTTSPCVNFRLAQKFALHWAML